MLVELKELIAKDVALTSDDEPTYRTIALIAIAERLDRLCDLVERAQRPDGAFKREKPL